MVSIELSKSWGTYSQIFVVKSKHFTDIHLYSHSVAGMVKLKCYYAQEQDNNLCQSLTHKMLFKRVMAHRCSTSLSSKNQENRIREGRIFPCLNFCPGNTWGGGGLGLHCL